MKSSLIVLSLMLFLYTAVFAQSSEYRIQPTDVLTITVHEHLDLATKTRVTADGQITFPLLGRLSVKGLTVQELEKKIKDSLEKDYIVNAQVLVFIEEYHPRQFSVMGEVRRPGKYDMPSEKDVTVLEAIAMAAGFSEDASINSTRIIRMDEGEKKTIIVKITDITKKGQKEKDIIIRPDDIVFVPESFF